VRRGLFEATFVDGFPDIHFGSEEVGLTIDNDTYSSTQEVRGGERIEEFLI